MLSDAALDALFRTARSQNGWLPRDVDDDQLRAIWDLAKLGPTSANCSPMRVVFVRGGPFREKLRPLLHPMNVEKVMTAPVVAVIGYDREFYRQLRKLFPHNPNAASWFSGPDKTKTADDTAFRNGSLQGAYLIMAARALGLDCGPMSGFDADAIDALFWRGTAVKTNFLCALGYGDPEKVFPRHPRLSFEDACKIV
jgi:3-hydroxypropanoate dehydrogenase